jgi:hypothetical protein
VLVDSKGIFASRDKRQGKADKEGREGWREEEEKKEGGKT